jgi:hypothetical protein
MKFSAVIAIAMVASMSMVDATPVLDRRAPQLFAVRARVAHRAPHPAP